MRRNFINSKPMISIEKKMLGEKNKEFIRRNAEEDNGPQTRKKLIPLILIKKLSKNRLKAGNLSSSVASDLSLMRLDSNHLIRPRKDITRLLTSRIMLKILGELPRRDPDHRLLLVGDGDQLVMV